MRRVLLSLALAGSISAVAAPAVFAHECTIASRSAQGDAGAQHSANWATLGLADIFGFIHGEVGGPALTPAQIDWAVAEAVAEGLPAGGWVTRADKTIGEGSSVTARARAARRARPASAGTRRRRPRRSPGGRR